MDLPGELFSCLSEDIICHTNFGHEFVKTNTELIHKIKEVRRAQYLDGCL